jgi:ankyrin repeat protein
MDAAARLASSATLIVVTALLVWAALGTPQPTENELVAAVSAGDLGGVRRALDQGISPDAVFGKPLGIAALAGDVPMTRLLLERGATPMRLGNVGWSPLQEAAALSGNTEVIVLLLDAGADVNEATSAGATPVSIAAGAGNLAALDLLLARGGDVKGFARPGCRPCHPPMVSAVRGGKGSPQLLQRLIDAGADIDAADDEGVTPVIAAAAFGRPDLIEFLVGAEARGEASLSPALQRRGQQR